MKFKLKKESIAPTLSIMAQSATMLGTCLAGQSVWSDMKPMDMVPWEGTGGGGSSSPFVISATHSVLSATVGAAVTNLYPFTVSFSVTCTVATDYMNCWGSILDITKNTVLTELSSQATCSVLAAATNITGNFARGTGAGRCSPGDAISINFQCADSNEGTVSNWGTGRNITSSCP